jgi:hypothetical protein
MVAHIRLTTRDIQNLLRQTGKLLAHGVNAA